MCGIVGYIGNNAIKNTIAGLKNLEYRGYDSSGIAYIKNNNIIIKKEVGRIDNLLTNLDYDNSVNIAIAHTRWATHGEANKTNAHPHKVGKITLVHNGIIENYEKLKENLTDYNFISNTDTEVIAALIDKLYNKYNDMKLVLSKITNLLKGSYALAIINDDITDKIFAIRKDSPLIVGYDNKSTIIASDIPAILHVTKKYYLLDNYDILEISSNELNIYDKDLNKMKKEENIYDENSIIMSKDGYEHYMLKEINEEPDIFRNILDKYIINDKIVDIYDISKYENIEIVACGSATHAGLIGKYYIENLTSIKTSVYYASEYRYQKHIYNQKTLVIVISQSGETADTKEALKIANEANLDTLAIVNVYKSSIARLAKNVIYTQAKIEVAVATTKAYMAQCLILLLLALKVNPDKTIINELHNIPNIMKKYIKKDYKEIASVISNYDHIFYLGRLVDYYLALEGSLKLKEISYIHSEAYPAGELKHGTISLMDKNVLVIAIVTDDKIKDKTISNIKEITARGTKVIAITNDNREFSDYKVLIEDNILIPFITIIPMQLIAYEVAKIKKCDIDKPRNLAKSVTVE